MKQLPGDGGPIYAETDLSSFVVEPWNAISSLAIVLPSVYWAFKLNWNIRDYGFMYFLMPLLFLGGTGSTIYHAFRASSYALALDVIPTAVVTISVGIYFWYKLLKNWYWIVLIIVPSFFVRFYLSTNFNYFYTGTLIFLPVLIYLIRHDFKYYLPIIASMLLLCVSLLFRWLDKEMTFLFPMGSHFLWHLLSGAGAFYLAQYLYLTRRDELSKNTG